MYTKIILLCTYLIMHSNAFVPLSYYCKPRKLIQYHTSMNMVKNMSDSKNTSKIYKLDFTGYNDDDMYEPKYAFGLSDIDMIFIRLYMYMVITIYNFIHIIQQIKK